MVTIESLPGARTAAAGGRPQAGLEFVEKLLPTKLTSTETTERNASMLLLLYPRPAPSYRWSSWLLVLAGRRVGPQGVDDLPAVACVHELEVLDVDGRANGRVRDRAVQVLNLDLDATVARVFALALTACRGLDHLQCRERCQPFGVGGPLAERPLGQLWVQRARCVRRRR